jgi:Calx-beta domain
MRATTGTIRRLVAAVLTAAIPTVGLALPASAAGPGATIRINDVSVTEGNTGTVNASFTISTSNLKGAASVHWATSAGTATAGTDFLAASGTVNLSKTFRNATVTVKVNGDVIDEPDETFSVQLSAPAGATIADATGVGTILDNDAAPVLSVTDATASEADDTVEVPVTMSGASWQTVTVHYATTSGSAAENEDYTAVSGTLTIPAGTSPAAIAVPLLDDATDETDETFQLSLSVPTNATVAAGTAQVTIADDDATPTISIADVSVDEGSGTATFDVTLSNPSAFGISADYATVDATAIAGEDYTTTTGTVSFVPGDVDATIDVPVTADVSDEPTQTFDVTLANPANVTIADGSAVASILDDDGGPWVSVDDVAVSETDGIATFTLTLDAASEQTVTVDYTTVNGTALSGSDYATVSGTATFDPGVVEIEVVVAIIDDTTYEGPETFGLALTEPINLSINTPLATATLASEEKAPAKLTMGVKKTKSSVVAEGTISYAVIGMKIRVTLLKRSAGHWVKVAAKTVTAKNLGDRNHDGVTDAAYKASFTRGEHGRYRLQALYAGSATVRACSALKRFTL